MQVKDNKTPETPTDDQIVERIALFMGYKKPTNPDAVEINDIDSYDFGTRTLWVWVSESEMQGRQYLDDWNDWREVELKIIENQMLWYSYVSRIGTGLNMMQADLPTRCHALIQALDSISPKE